MTTTTPRQAVVLRSILDRKTYLKYAKFISGLKTIEGEYKKVFNTLKFYWQKYPDQEVVSVDELSLFYTQTQPLAKDAEKEVMQRIFRMMRDVDINNPDLFLIELNALCEQHYASLIWPEISMAVDGTGRGSLDKVADLIDEYKEFIAREDEDDPDVCMLDYAELLELDRKDGLQWRIQCLNETIGPLQQGTLGHVFAYSETGKTGFGVSEAANFALQQTDRNVLYLGNEEWIVKVRQRIVWALLDKPRLWCQEHPKEVNKMLLQMPAYKRIITVDDVTTVEKVEQNIMRFKPIVVFIDQGPNVQSFEDDSASETRKLQRLYNRYRRLAKKYKCAIITMGQADASCSNRRYLSLANMDSSKVGIPGELDLAIGIGRVDEEGLENIRFISVCKNKLTGTQARHEVYFDKERSLYL